MKEIKACKAQKYENPEYTFIEEGIYKTNTRHGEMYVTTLCFVQEPEFGEGTNASNISQYPLEDLLDKFYCHISDFYEGVNTADSQICYQEFGSPDLEDIKKLRTIIGKHVYNKEDGDYVKLVIE